MIGWINIGKPQSMKWVADVALSTAEVHGVGARDADIPQNSNIPSAGIIFSFVIGCLTSINFRFFAYIF